MREIVNLPDHIYAEKAVSMINIADAVRRLLLSWNVKVTTATIANCFGKVGFIDAANNENPVLQDNLKVFLS